jgi:hypothetical protein
MRTALFLFLRRAEGRSSVARVAAGQQSDRDKENAVGAAKR